jgi:anti-repressor protein
VTGAELQTFANGEFEIEVRPTEDGSFTVLAPGLARALGFRDARDMMLPLSSNDCSYELVRTNAGLREVGCVTEAGFYRAVGQRQAARITDPEARAAVERFQSWVFGEVLPSIRRHGAFLTPQKIEEALLDPDVIIRLATDLKAEREARQALEAKTVADAPKVLFADAVACSESTILIGELAKSLQGTGLDIGQNRLFERMRQDGFLSGRKGADWNLPTQRAMDLGLFRIKETAITHPDGRVSVSTTVKVTGKGQQYFAQRYLGGQLEEGE